MTSEEFKQFRDDFLEKTIDLSDIKRIEYTVGNQDDDVFTNFREVGKRLNLPPVDVLGVYLFKHIDSLTSFFKHGKTFSEPLESRISDIVNYCILLLGLIDDEREGESYGKNYIRAYNKEEDNGE
jgi:hypothetical protein